MNSDSTWRAGIDCGFMGPTLDRLAAERLNAPEGSMVVMTATSLGYVDPLSSEVREDLAELDSLNHADEVLDALREHTRELHVATGCCLVGLKTPEGALVEGVFPVTAEELAQVTREIQERACGGQA